MMDKQINLYRNLHAGADRRRLQRNIAILGLAIALALGWALRERLDSQRKASERAIAALEVDVAREKTLIETLGGELKRSQTAPDRAAQATLGQDLALVAAREGNELGALTHALGAWRGEGAVLKRFAYDRGLLTVTGEARGAKQAKVATMELMALLGANGEWVAQSHELRQAEIGRPRMEFKMIARLAKESK